MVCSYAIEDATCPIRSADAKKYLETFCLRIGSRQPHPMLFKCGCIIARMQKSIKDLLNAREAKAAWEKPQFPYPTHDSPWSKKFHMNLDTHRKMHIIT